MQSNQYANTVWRRYPEAHRRLRHLITTDKASFGEAARVLSIESGQRVTRNMVIGMVRRSGLIGQGNPPTPRKGEPIAARPGMVCGITLPGGYRYYDGRITVGIGGQ